MLILSFLTVLTGALHDDVPQPRRGYRLSYVSLSETRLAAVTASEQIVLSAHFIPCSFSFIPALLNIAQSTPTLEVNL
jgi:hypothetical protein